MSAVHKATATRVPAGPYELIRLSAGELTVTAAPALGGRLLSVTLAGSEFLYRNPRLLGADLAPLPGVEAVPHDGPMALWRNWGGDKTWPAPQGWDGPDQWAGPPDPVLDSGRYDARTRESGDTARLDMVSGVEPRTGLRVTRSVTVEAGSTAFRLDITLTNASDRPRRWAAWNITQLAGTAPGDDGDLGVYLGTARSGRPATVPLVAGTGNPLVRDLDGVLHVPHQDIVGKAGFPDAAGWLAHVGPGRTLTQRFPVTAGLPYPDDDSRAEVWLEHPLSSPLEHLGGLQPADRVVECETLGPLTDLAPGDSTRLTVEFGAAAVAAPVRAVTAGGFWTVPPRVADGRLHGRFTAFRDGPLTAVPPGGGTPRPCGSATAGRECAVHADVTDWPRADGLTILASGTTVFPDLSGTDQHPPEHGDH